MILKKEERIDDLQCDNLKIIQDTTGFCFGIDSVILSEFATEIKGTDNVVDLGSGTGILGLLIYGKRNVNNIIGVEIQKEVSEMAQRSIELNGIKDKFKIINEDLKNIISKNLVKKNSIDVVIANPPYKEISTGVINKNEKKLISRHEVSAKLEDFINTSSQILKNKGILYMVHKPERLVDIITLLRKYKIEPKEIRIVYPSINKGANLLLIKAVKGANKFIKIDKPLYIYNENNEYSDEIKNVYK